MKSKRLFLPNNLDWILSTLFDGFIVLGIPTILTIGTVLECKQLGRYDPVGYCVGLSLLALIRLPVLLAKCSWNLHMDSEFVWMRGDWPITKRYRIQYPVQVAFSEISSLDLEYSYKNSKGADILNIRGPHPPLWAQKRYLIFLLANGKKKRVYVSHFNDPSLAIIIDEIATRAEATGAHLYDGKRAAAILFKD